MRDSKSFNISKQLIWEAWKQVKANKGSAGIDNQSIEEFEINLKDNLYKIWNRMSSGCYFPSPVLAVPIPKKSGGTRILGIPSISDRVSQTAAKMVLENKLELLFYNDSYGYRPGKSALDAIAVTKQRCWKYNWLVEFDIVGLFDNISHELLMKALRKHVDERWVLLYVERWLTAPLQNRDGSVIPRFKGTPQGGVVSPVLCNLFLHYVFDHWMTREFPNLKWARYSDDGIVHCMSKAQAYLLKDKLTARFRECGLELHPEKTCIVNCSGSRSSSPKEVNQFTFLGYTFKPRKTKNKKTGKIFNGFLPAVSDLAIKSMKREVKYKWRLKSKVQASLIDLARWVNPILQGWINYYGKHNIHEMRKLARFIDDHICIWARNKFQKLFRHRTRSYDWLRRVFSENSRLFVHWRYFKVY